MIDKVLICCFDFPPNNDIGGRRWGKLAKGLANQGIQVFVLKADVTPQELTSPWSGDVIHPNIHITSVPRPRWTANSRHNGVLAGIWHRIAKIRTKIIERGTIYDAAIGWEKSFNTRALSIITANGIKCVIATGAPFNLLYYTAKIKAQLGNIFLISDYRDPWIHARNYGMAALNSSRLQVEKEKEKLVLEESDVVTCPAIEILEQVMSDNPWASKTKFIELPHFFDEDDIIPSEVSSGDVTSIQFVYGGALYQGLEVTIKELDKIVSEYHRKYGLLPSVKFTFHSDDYLKYKGEISNPECIEFLPSIGEAIRVKLSRSHGVLILLSSHNKDFFTTKFFDNLPYKKPYIFLGQHGKVSEYISNQRIGFEIHNLSDLEHVISELIPRRLDPMEERFELVMKDNNLHKRTEELLALIGGNLRFN